MADSVASASRPSAVRNTPIGVAAYLTCGST